MEAEYRWYAVCMRAYRVDQIRTDGKHKLCAYADCVGSEISAFPWEQVRLIPTIFGTLPAVPELDRAYPIWA